MSALPLSARRSTKRRTSSADLSKSHSSSSRQAAASSSSKDSRSRAVSRRRSTIPGGCERAGCIWAAMRRLLLYPVHGGVAQLLPDEIPRVRNPDRRHLAGRIELRREGGIDAAPVSWNIQFLVARRHFVAQLGIEVHAILVYQGFDGRVVPLGLDAHQLGQQHAYALAHLVEVLQRQVGFPIALRSEEHTSELQSR